MIKAFAWAKLIASSTPSNLCPKNLAKAGRTLKGVHHWCIWLIWRPCNAEPRIENCDSATTWRYQRVAENFRPKKVKDKTVQLIWNGVLNNSNLNQISTGNRSYSILQRIGELNFCADGFWAMIHCQRDCLQTDTYGISQHKRFLTLIIVKKVVFSKKH